MVWVAGVWGVMSAAVEHAHCNTTINSIQLLDEGKQMMAHEKVVDRCEEAKPTPIPPDAKVTVHTGGEIADTFFTTVNIDDYLLIKVQHSDDDTTALIASASLASDHVRFFGPGEEGVIPSLAPNKSTDGDTRNDALGFTINSHTMELSFSRVNVDAIAILLREQ